MISEVSGMLDCRRCGNGTKAVAEEPVPPAGDRTQTVRRTRECVGCNARAETTEGWSYEDDAEFYRTRYGQAAEWLSQPAFLLKAPTLTARMADDWVRKDLERHAAGLGPGRTGDRERIASKARARSVPCLGTVTKPRYHPGIRKRT